MYRHTWHSRQLFASRNRDFMLSVALCVRNTESVSVTQTWKLAVFWEDTWHHLHDLDDFSLFPVPTLVLAKPATDVRQPMAKT